MLITHVELLEFARAGVIEGASSARVNGASIDVCLGPYLHVERGGGTIVDLAHKEVPRMNAREIPPEGYKLAPGEFVLAQTVEVFNLPNDIALEFRLKSSAARAGLDNSLATWGAPGWHDSVLTLELRNNLRYHHLKLRAGMPIGQVIFWRGNPVPEGNSYAVHGQYNRDKTAQQSKGIR